MLSEKSQRSLEQLLRTYPLLSDLHIHLLGTGSISFWRNQMIELADTVVDQDTLTRANIGWLNEKVGRQVVLGDIPHWESALEESLVLREPKPGCFDSAFSPLFVLRSFLITKKPTILERLIVWNAMNFKADGIHYVEFSLGADWFKEPFADALVEGASKAKRESQVIVRFLVSFNRGKISEAIHNEIFLRNLSRHGDRKLGYAHEPEHYTPHLEQLHSVRETLMKQRQLRHCVVGLDIVGNEENKPYMPFLLPDFLRFASEMKKENENFGFRIHLGEGFSADADVGYVSMRLGEYFVSTLSKHIDFVYALAMGSGSWAYVIQRSIGGKTDTQCFEGQLPVEFKRIFASRLSRLISQATFI